MASPTTTLGRTTAETTLGPSIAETTLGRTTAETTLGLTTAETTLGPTTAETTLGPTTAETTLGTTTAETTLGLTTAETTLGLSTAETTLEPATAETTLGPTTAETTLGLTTAETTMGPTTAETTLGPTTAETTLGPTTARPTTAHATGLDTDTADRQTRAQEPLAHDIYDWSAGVSLLQLSFVLDQLLPRRHIRQSLTAHTRERMDAMLAFHYGDSPELKPEPTGSFYEGFGRPFLLPLPFRGPADVYGKTVIVADVDLMVIALHKPVITEGQETAESVGVIEADDTHKGYIRIRMLHPESSAYKIPKTGTQEFYLSSTAIMRDFEEGVLAKLTQDFIEILWRGPAITVYEHEKIKRNTIDLDSVMALPCPEWPGEAAYWLTRHRPSGWPEKQLIQGIVAAGCHIVPTSHSQSVNPDAEWRYSFSVAERTLAQTLTEAQRHCYILFKTIVLDKLSHSSVLSSYHLKNLFLWQCEKIPASEWSSDTGLAANLLCLLDRLLHCVATHCLPHYFISDNNLLDHVHPDFLVDIACLVSHIRHKPLQSVLDFNRHYRFTFSVVNFDLAYILADVISDAVQYHNNNRERYKKQWNVLLTHGVTHLREGRHDEATSVFTQMAELAYRLSGEHITELSLMCTASLTLDTAQAVVAFEYLRTAFPDHNSVLGNLACMYHVAAYTADSEDRRHEMLLKAEENFQKSVACSGVNTAANKMDYAMFLVHQRRYNNVSTLLKEIIASERNNPGARNLYGKNERNSIDDENLLKEINHHQKLATVSVALAYYVLAKIYCDTDQRSDAEALLPEFLLLCNNTLTKGKVDTTDHACAYSLLGYTYLAVLDYNQAMQAFSKAVQLKHDYSLAEENRTLCEALKLSMLSV